MLAIVAMSYDELQKKAEEEEEAALLEEEAIRVSQFFFFSMFALLLCYLFSFSPIPHYTHVSKCDEV